MSIVQIGTRYIKTGNKQKIEYANGYYLEDRHGNLVYKIIGQDYHGLIILQKLDNFCTELSLHTVSDVWGMVKVNPEYYAYIYYGGTFKSYRNIDDLLSDIQ